MSILHLDTHVAAWLWAGDRTRLRPVWPALVRSDLAISGATILELGFLFEIGRLTEPANLVVKELIGELGLQISGAPLGRVVEEALLLTWTRDPFDRLIAANARCDDARLVTKDRRILDHCPWARWS
ncbi:MAG: PIN domain-containing protein [Deltaproteobacteria bacterium]|nr:PIN domain-containing protein [Deltaproteobacteria bacterium]